MSSETTHLIVESGPDKGMEITVPKGGARAGRSSNNEIVFKDPAMSRFHCRFFFKKDDGLWAEDLGSANQTMLNGKPLHEARVRTGDLLVIGDTSLKVISDTSHEEALPGPLFDREHSRQVPPKIDVLRRPSKPLLNQKRSLLLFGIAGAIAFAATLTWVLNQLNQGKPQLKPEPAPKTASMVEISYEKIQAGSDNIFRYEMELISNKLSIQVDDLKNRRHVAKTQHKKVENDVVLALLQQIEESGFFELQPEYKGRTSSVWDAFDLSVTVGRMTHRVVVQNRLEPAEFKNVREAIEEFGRNELGLAALELSIDKLSELAMNAWLIGQNLYDQRQVKNENLALALRSLKEMDWYLETVEPKPDYYAKAITLMSECERELDEINKDELFLADKAIRLQNWEEAALHLRLLCEKIPDRSDERHKSARKKLLEVERRLKRN